MRFIQNTIVAVIGLSMSLIAVVSCKTQNQTDLVNVEAKMKAAAGHFFAGTAGLAFMPEGDTSVSLNELRSAITACKSVLAVQPQNLECLLISGQSYAAMSNDGWAKKYLVAGLQSSAIKEGIDSTSLVTAATICYVNILTKEGRPSEGISILKSVSQKTNFEPTIAEWTLYLVAQTSASDAKTYREEIQKHHPVTSSVNIRMCDGVSLTSSREAFTCYEETLNRGELDPSQKLYVESKADFFRKEGLHTEGATSPALE